MRTVIFRKSYRAGLLVLLLALTSIVCVFYHVLNWSPHHLTVVEVATDSTYMRHFQASELIHYPANIDLLDTIEKIRRGKSVGVAPVNNAVFDYHPSAHTTACRRRSTDLLILAKSAPGNAELRSAIRRSWGDPGCWGDQLKLKLTTLFLVARSDSASVDQAVARESETYGDLVVANFRDSYYNNTLKLMSGILWSQKYCKNATLVLFVDDDFVLNPRTLSPYMNSAARSPAISRLFAGRLRFHERPTRPWPLPFGLGSDKWTVDWSMYSSEFYPPFLPAGFMLVGGKLLADVALALPYVKYYPFDDIYLALVMNKLLIQPLHISDVFTQPHLTPSISSEAFRFSRAVHLGSKRGADMLKAWDSLPASKQCLRTKSAKNI